MSDRHGSGQNTLDRHRHPFFLFCQHVEAILEMEFRKLCRDPYEMIMRGVQPILWLLIFGETFSQLRTIPTGQVSYLAFLTPGILSQSITFISIFYGITIIWERDMGQLQKILTTPIYRSAFILGKMLSATLRAVVQVVIISGAALLLGVPLQWGIASFLGTLLSVMLGASFFSGFSIVLASLLRTRERMMGMGQLITMPLFFSSNALYPLSLMPPWLRVVATLNPMSYLVDALRGMLLPVPAHIALDFVVLGGAMGLMLGLATRLIRYRLSS